MNEICDQLEQLPRPFVDRSTVKVLLQVGRRRTQRRRKGGHDSKKVRLERNSLKGVSVPLPRSVESFDKRHCRPFIVLNLPFPCLQKPFNPDALLLYGPEPFNRRRLRTGRQLEPS
jgi:hypothetical protein